MDEFALIKSRVNLSRVNYALALISDIKAFKSLDGLILKYVFKVPIFQITSTSCAFMSFMF